MAKGQVSTVPLHKKVLGQNSSRARPIDAEWIEVPTPPYIDM